MKIQNIPQEILDSPLYREIASSPRELQEDAEDALYRLAATIGINWNSSLKELWEAVIAIEIGEATGHATALPDFGHTIRGRAAEKLGREEEKLEPEDWKNRFDIARSRRKFPDYLKEWQDNWTFDRLQENKERKLSGEAPLPITTQDFLEDHTLPASHHRVSLAHYLQPKEFERLRDNEAAPGDRMMFVLGDAIPEAVCGRVKNFIRAAQRNQEAHPEAIIETDKFLPSWIRNRMAAYTPGSCGDQIYLYRNAKGWNVQKMGEEVNDARRKRKLRPLHFVHLSRFEHTVVGTAEDMHAFADALGLSDPQRERLLAAHEKQSGRALLKNAQTPGEIIRSVTHSKGPLTLEKLASLVEISPNYMRIIASDTTSYKTPLAIPLAKKIGPHLGEEAGKKFLTAVDAHWRAKVEAAPTLGEKLIVYRERAGLDSNQARKALGTSRQNVHRKERGIDKLPPAKLEKFMRLYELSPDEKAELRLFAEFGRTLPPSPGDILGKIMQEMSLKTSKLAATCNLSYQHLHDILEDTSTVNRLLAAQIAAHLGEAGATFHQSVEYHWRKAVLSAHTTGERMRQYRLRGGEELKDIALKTGVHESAVARMEKRPSMTLPVFKKYGVLYPISLTEAQELEEFHREELHAAMDSTFKKREMQKQTPLNEEQHVGHQLRKKRKEDDRSTAEIGRRVGLDESGVRRVEERPYLPPSTLEKYLTANNFSSRAAKVLRTLNTQLRDAALKDERAQDKEHHTGRCFRHKRLVDGQSAKSTGKEVGVGGTTIDYIEGKPCLPPDLFEKYLPAYHFPPDKTNELRTLNEQLYRASLKKKPEAEENMSADTPAQAEPPSPHMESGQGALRYSASPSERNNSLT